MQDRELYEQILGLSSPWKVTKVELKARPGGARFCGASSRHEVLLS